MTIQEIAAKHVRQFGFPGATECEEGERRQTLVAGGTSVVSTANGWPSAQNVATINNADIPTESGGVTE